MFIFIGDDYDEAVQSIIMIIIIMGRGYSDYDYYDDEHYEFIIIMIMVILF